MDQSLGRASRQPRSKAPYGYWNDIDNVVREITSFIAARDTGSSLPNSRELREAGRRDLDNAITKHGGYAKFRKLLDSPSDRKDPGYWTNWTNLERELMDFVGGSPSDEDVFMPTQQELRTAGRNDLLQGIRKHGGFASVAERSGLRRRRKVRVAGYWDNIDNLRSELRSFVEGASETDVLVMPTRQQLRNGGRTDLDEAISRHGGLRQVAELLGYRYNRSEKGYWAEFCNLALEIYEFIERVDEQDNYSMPSLPELRKNKRADIAVAINHHGGMAEVSKKLGLQYVVRTGEAMKRWDVFRTNMLNFIHTHGEEGALPSQRLLGNFKREDLVVGVLHHGGPEEVASRLELRSVSSTWHFCILGRKVLRFVRLHGVQGVMPLEDEFAAMRRRDLHMAVEKFGYQQTARRLGLNPQVDKTERVLDAIRKNTGLDPSWPSSDSDIEYDIIDQHLTPQDLGLGADGTE